MYVFILDGCYDALLDMSLEEAEQYVIRRFAACGETPCYRHFYDDIKDDINNISHFVEYGTYYDGIYTKPSRLKYVTPRVVNERPIPDDCEEQLTIWEGFITDANNTEGHYYEVDREE